MLDRRLCIGDVTQSAAYAPSQCVCEWRERGPLFVRLEREVRRDLAAGRLPPVQPFHIMAYPFPADLAKVPALVFRGQGVKVFKSACCVWSSAHRSHRLPGPQWLGTHAHADVLPVQPV